MPSANPMFRGDWSKKFHATVFSCIWPEVGFFTAIATMVTLVSKNTPKQLAIDPQLMTVLGTVLGLVISFRTSSAYEKYEEGRKLWTNITVNSRILAQLIWIGVPDDRSGDKARPHSNIESIIEKKSMINIVQALSVSVKHFLRGENGIYYQDLYPLICFLPRYASCTIHRSEMLPLWQASEDGEHPLDEEEFKLGCSSTLTSLDTEAKTRTPWTRVFHSASRDQPFDPEKALAVVRTHRILKPARNPPPTSIYDYLPILLIFKWVAKKVTQGKRSVLEGERRDALGRKIKPVVGDSNVPMEITIHLNNYVAYLMRNSLLGGAIGGAVMDSLVEVQATLNHMERIANTPLPFAYQAHLRISLWIYLCLLPFQLYDNFGYLTIPGTAFASFLLLGFLEIGQEIEEPFGYDQNDLDLDAFCLAISRDLHEITSNPILEPSRFVFSERNQPFAPADRRTAEELVKGGTEYKMAENSSKGLDNVRSTLLRSWRDVEGITRV